ncbi:Serine/threonine-protein kinase AfsK [Polystyrenella longa]|uniref:Serine/threonine-protein kinase AfsK n=1 Tax=Polystyrenella longa TaxID=2528007 RepID=A0A518CR15_9PLAN|nr:PQQ-binding-like beta-propeller repeat protein [Polystyrenella longa]QDU81650.1 Serine/threonine-protein kinase AfsK [Polystyrenella longa]
MNFTRSLFLVGGLFTGLAFCTVSSGEDWPTYYHDYSRSGVTSESLKGYLEEKWAWKSRYRPQPAWDEPAKWDGWHRVFGLKNRQEYDKAFHVAIVGDTVFFGSSVEDKVYALNSKTGEELWRFYMEGPVRLAPTVVDNKVYVGADDGFVYCLNSADGKLIWKKQTGTEDRRVPSNGRLTSLWAIRTGVVVMDDIAYFCGGVFPSENVYLFALNTDSGEEVYREAMTDFPAQGYMLASGDRLYVTTGRHRPLVFERSTGKRMYQADGDSTGSYAILNNDQLIYGPGITGTVSIHSEGQETQLASFEGNHILVTGELTLVHQDKKLVAIEHQKYVDTFSKRAKLLQRKKQLGKDLKKLKEDEAKAKLQTEIDQLSQGIDKLSEILKECVVWETDCDHPFTLIQSGNQIYAGGLNEVGVYDLSKGRLRLILPVEGAAYGLAVANGRLVVSTDRGNVHSFGSEDEEVAASK